MKIYSETWARKIVSQWRASDPRVDAMIAKFGECARRWGCPDPAEYPVKRIIGCLRTARHTDTWRIIKAAVNHQIVWPHIFEKYILTTEDMRRYVAYQQLHFDY